MGSDTFFWIFSGNIILEIVWVFHPGDFGGNAHRGTR